MRKTYPIKDYFQAERFRVTSWAGFVFAVLFGTFLLSEWLAADVSQVAVFVIFLLLFFPMFAGVRDKLGFKMQYVVPVSVLIFGWKIVSLEQMPLHHEILVLACLVWVFVYGSTMFLEPVNKGEGNNDV